MGKREQYCFWCGESLGVYEADRRDRDTCGKLECNRQARDDERAERDEAHDRLDRDMGWE